MKNLYLILAILIVACGSGVHLYYNFEQNKPIKTPVGGDMVFIKQGDGRNSFIQYLSYSGKEGTTIRVSFRENVSGLDRHQSTQHLSYDLSEDSTIVFRAMRIRVLSATNSMIEFIVTESPVYQHKSGEKL